MATKSLRRSIGWALVGLAISMTGCASFPTSAPAVDSEEVAALADVPSCTVVYRDKREDVRAVKIPLDGMVTVGKALEDTDILRLRRRNKVIIYRKTDRPEPVRLEVELEGRKVKEQFNYALFPDDQVIVGPDNKSPIDALMKGLGPLGR